MPTPELTRLTSGFCAHDDLAQDDPNGLCGNYGLYDVVKMFEWVRAIL